MPGNVNNISPSDTTTWPAPNYVDPVRRTWLVPFVGTLYAVGTIMAFTRLALRATKRAGGLGLDDAFLFASWLVGTAATVLSLVDVINCFADRHTWDVPPSGFVRIAFIFWLSEITVLASSGCLKVSVLLWYRRILKRADGIYSRWWSYAIGGGVLFTVAFTLAFILSLCLTCTPIEADWKAFGPGYTDEHHCVDTKIASICAGVAATMSDLYAVVLPCLMTRRMSLSRRQRLVLNAICSLGSLVVVACALRTYYLYLVGTAPDVVWNMFNTLLCCQVEIYVGIMCASAPAMRVLYRIVHRRGEDTGESANDLVGQRKGDVEEHDLYVLPPPSESPRQLSTVHEERAANRTTELHKGLEWSVSTGESRKQSDTTDSQ